MLARIVESSELPGKLGFRIIGVGNGSCFNEECLAWLSSQEFEECDGLPLPCVSHDNQSLMAGVEFTYQWCPT